VIELETFEKCNQVLIFVKLFQSSCSISSVQFASFFKGRGADEGATLTILEKKN